MSSQDDPYDGLRQAAEAVAASDTPQDVEITDVVAQYAHDSWQGAAAGLAAHNLRMAAADLWAARNGLADPEVCEENATARLELLASPRPAVA